MAKSPRRHGPAVLALLLVAVSGPARAQQLVYDPSAVAKLVDQAQTALRQLEQAKRLADGFNQASGMDALALVLKRPELRAVVPAADAFLKAARGDLSGLGALGADAARLRAESRPASSPAVDLQAAGDRAARDLALGKAVADAGAQRLTGLEQLAAALPAAASPRAVMDLQARLAAEQAMIANDQMRLQGLAMAQAAEARLETQRQRERMAAASDARLALFRQAFQ